MCCQLCNGFPSQFCFVVSMTRTGINTPTFGVSCSGKHCSTSCRSLHLSWYRHHPGMSTHMNLKNTPFSIVMHELILFVALIKHFGRLACGCEWGQVRKVCQSIAFLAPAACLAIASAKLNVNPWVKVAVLATGIGLSSFTLAGVITLSPASLISNCLLLSLQVYPTLIVLSKNLMPN